MRKQLVTITIPVCGYEVKYFEAGHWMLEDRP